MTDSTTDRAEYYFKVSEYADGTPWIYFELRRPPNLPMVSNGFLGMDLPAGTSYKEAEKIADFLNENIKCVTATSIRQVASGAALVIVADLPHSYASP